MSAGRGTLHLAARRKPHQRPRLSQRGAGETTNSALPHDSLKFSLRLKPRLVLKAIIAGQAAHQLASPPIIENAAEILARDPSHSASRRKELKRLGWSQDRSALLGSDGLLVMAGA